MNNSKVIDNQEVRGEGSTNLYLNKKGDKKTIRGWQMFDWANSAYSLVVTSAVFPIFYEGVTTSRDEVGNVTDLVMEAHKIPNTSLYSYFISAGFLIAALMVPLLSGIADYSNNKKIFMKFFTIFGGLACMGLFFFDPNNVIPGLIMVMLACIGYSGSIVFYDAYLPEIADVKDHDKISAGGYSMGYIGSVLLLIFCLFMITSPDTFGIPEVSGNPMAPRIACVLVGVWWIAFAQITFRRLVKEPKMSKVPTEIFSKGYRELRKVWKEVKNFPVLKWFLSAYFFFNMGVLTVMYLAANFAAKEIKQIDENGVERPMETMQLIITILIIQLVAIVGATVFSKLSKRIGNLKVLSMGIIAWIAICITAYFVEYSTAFFFLAGCVGMVMGGIQALSRSTYSKLLPETIDHASYFSFFEICQFLGTIIGTFTFGFVLQMTGNIRNSILAVLVFFVVGLFLLSRVSSKMKSQRIASDIEGSS
ncbi:MAG: UMF1 family MFS transporter [Patiriisocius sp.]|jgi:UMF1 family MFS transporter